MILADRTVDFRSRARSDAGCIRPRNEDAWLARDALGPGIGLWAVADGMGGHLAGEEASGYVVAELARIAAPAGGHAGLAAIEQALQAANTRMRARAQALGPPALVGSTAVVLFTFERHYAVLWAGDSRAYLLREGRLNQLTRDDRLVQPLLDARVLSPKEARRHPQANVLTRALGADGEATFSLVDGPVRPGDRFLLCSDGLSDVAGPAELRHALAEGTGAVDRLMSLALARGAPDNVTCLAVEAG